MNPLPAIGSPKFIGTDVTGLFASGNPLNGVLINGLSGNLVGGTNAGDRSVISTVDSQFWPQILGSGFVKH